jgi:outer membrane lipoprotein-sorting protein
VSEFGDLLALMHAAVGRTGTVSAVLFEQRRPELLKRAFQRFGERVEFARGGGYFYVPLGGVAPGEQAEVHRWQVELWAEQGRFRQERRGPDAEHVLVVDGERWWSWSPAMGLESHEDSRGVHHSGAGLELLDPTRFLSGFDLDPAGEAVVAGRAARRVHVRARDLERHEPGGLEPGIEEAELLLDRERGLILRQAELFECEEAFVREVEEIAYDVRLPAETFVFKLPPGATAANPLQPEITTVDRVAELASFPVFKLDPAPPGWRVHAMYVAATERPTLPDAVTLLYTRADGGERLRILERTSEHELPAIGGERRFERSGRSYIALGPEQPVGREPSELIFALDGTQIRMSSSELAAAALLDYADQLAPA